MSKINVVIDKAPKHVINVSVDLTLTVKGELDLADLISKAIADQLRGKVARLGTGDYTLRAFCTITEPADGTNKPQD